MANEITLTASLTANKPGSMAQAVALSFVAKLFNMNGQQYTKLAALLTPTAALISTGQVSQPHWAAFYSNPTSNGALPAPTPTTISGAANNGAGLVRITDTSHGYITGDAVMIAGIVGTTEANGTWQITFVDANHFDLQGSTFVNTYASGGTALLLPTIRVRNGTGGGDICQLFVGEIAVVPLPIAFTPAALCDPTGQLLEYMLLDY